MRAVLRAHCWLDILIVRCEMTRYAERPRGDRVWVTGIGAQGERRGGALEPTDLARAAKSPRRTKSCAAEESRIKLLTLTS